MEHEDPVYGAYLDGLAEERLAREDADADNPKMNPSTFGDWLYSECEDSPTSDSDWVARELSALEADPARISLKDNQTLVALLLNSQHPPTTQRLLNEVVERFVEDYETPLTNAEQHAVTIMSYPLGGL